MHLVPLIAEGGTADEDFSGRRFAHRATHWMCDGEAHSVSVETDQLASTDARVKFRS